jgi:predicted nucleic acid-binding protein
LVIVDASAVLEWLLQTRVGIKIFNKIAGEEVHAPHLLDIEVAQSLRRMVRKRLVAESRAQFALYDLADAHIIRHPHVTFLPVVWALRHNISAYDAVYVALAEAHEATLLTCDAKLAAAPGHMAHVEYIHL